MGFLVSAAESGETHVELPFPAEAFGIVALVVLMALLALTFAFRSVGRRQRH